MQGSWFRIMVHASTLAASIAAARASFLAASRARTSFLVMVGADGAGPSGLVMSVTYSTRRFS